MNKTTNLVNKDLYQRVLNEKVSQAGMNRGFRLKDIEMVTYTQWRDAFTYFYPKRKVLSDGRSTTYLDI